MILVLLLLWLALVLIGFLIKAVFWLAIVGIVFFIITVGLAAAKSLTHKQHKQP